MSDNKVNQLEQSIKDSRNIKDTSLKTYISALAKLKKTLEPDKDSQLNDTMFLQDFKKVMDVINSEKKITSKKNKLTAIIVALNSDKLKNESLIAKFNNVLKDLGEKYTSFLKKQQKTETQQKNWLNYEDLITVANKLMRDVKNSEIKDKEKISKKECDMLQQLVILRTYLTFPLRNDFANMKIVDNKKYKKIPEAEKKLNNYLVLSPKNKKEFKINQYKNEKFLGEKSMDVPPTLNRIINLWLKYNKSGYYLIKCNKDEPMNPNGITKYLNKIFLKYYKKKISTSMIRHIIISHSLEGEKTIKEKEADEKKIKDTYLHSGPINDLYRKVDKKTK